MQTDIRLTPEQAEALLAEWLGSSVKCTGVQPLHGGMINSVLRLDFDRAPFSAVVKLNSAAGGFSREARMLRHLRETTHLPCPAVYLEGDAPRSIPYSFLLLEMLPGVNMWHAPLSDADRAQIERELAGALLELHSHTRATFGAIGEPGAERWADVFVPRMREVRPKVDGKLPAHVLRDVDCAIGVAAQVLSEQGEPALVHGDVWAANIMIAQAEDGWHLSGLLDPSAEYADVEIELAYLQTFGARPTAFFKTYTAQRPLRPGYETRRLFYWLNTCLIHVWLFGDRHYCEATASVAAEIARRV
jgi:fructosamine-3-kinase